MVTIKSTYFPRNSNPFRVFQEYAWRFYMGLFFALMLVLLYQLARRGVILWPGVIGVFATVVLANLFAIVRMRKDLAEIGFHEGHFYLRDVYQTTFGQKADFFPLPYANAQLRGDQLTVTYFDSIYILNRDEWEKWDDLLYYFGFRWYQV